MVKVKEYTNKGGREENEDSLSVFFEDNRLCAIVADGLGGHGDGRLASSMAVEFVGEKFSEQGEAFVRNLDKNMEKLNSMICCKQTDNTKMRTTIAVLVIENESVTSAHIGDSRIYRFMDNKITDMTFDHSVSQMAVLTGEISQAEVRHHIDRDKLLRSLGKAEGVKTEFNSWENNDKDKCRFLLCTDGFWEHIEENEMETCLKNSKSTEEWMDKMLKIVEERVNETSDNYTAITVWCE